MVRGVLGFVVGVVLWMPTFFLIVFLVSLAWPEYASHGRVWFETGVYTFARADVRRERDGLGVGGGVRRLGRRRGCEAAAGSLGACRGARRCTSGSCTSICIGRTFPWWYNVAVAGLAAPAVLLGSKLARPVRRRSLVTIQ